LTTPDDLTLHDSAPPTRPRPPLLARVDVALGALALALGTWLLVEPSRVARSAAASGQAMIDEGAMLPAAGLLIFLPIGALLVAAGIGLWRDRTWGRVVHYVALFWPFLLAAIVVVAEGM
jgi:hypothetical protein